MTEKILLVDDDPNILSAYFRVLHSRFNLQKVQSGSEGLRMLAAEGPYAVIVSDLRMPGMTGIEFLTKSKEVSPDTVRMLLTGHVDLKAAMDAVNQGWVFRFLAKPCPPENLSQALQAGIDQYRLISAERELLQDTLNGSIRVLTEILSIVDPESFGRGNSLRESIRVLAHATGITETWELELAAMLAQIGYVTVPPSILVKKKSGQLLSTVEQEMIAHAPQTGHNLLENIPRLKSVAKAVLYQNKFYCGSGFPEDSRAGTQIPIGARLLKVLIDMAQLQDEGFSRAKALEEMRKREGWYDPSVLDAAFLCFAPFVAQTASLQRARCFVAASGLRVGQILLDDIATTGGTLLIRSGHWISETLLERIGNFAKLNGIREPIQVETIDDARSNGVA